MKTKLFLALYALIVANVWAQFPTNGLVAQYGFESSSVLVDGAVGQNFTQTGTALTQINDRFGNPPTSAVDLNGDHLTRSDINFGGSTNNFNMSYSFWIKTSTNNNDIKTIIDDSTRNTVPGFDSNDVGYYIYLRNGKIGLSSRFYESDPNVISIARGFGSVHPTVISDNNWHHVVVVYRVIFLNSATAPRQQINCKIYVDGALEDKNSLYNSSLASPSHNTNGNITLANSRANHLTNTNRYMDKIDDLLAYNRVLTPQEITNIGTFNNFCLVPTTNTFTISRQQTSLLLTFPTTATSIDYDIAYHKVGEPFSNATILTDVTDTTNTPSITGLLSNTQYSLYIREQCTSTSVSQWSTNRNETTLRPIGRIYVNANATGSNNGISWTDGYTSLQSALAVVTNNNEEIWIASGTYTPSATDRSTSFVIEDSNVKIYGGFAGTETQLNERIFGTNETILSGDLLGNDSGSLNFSNTTKNDNSYNIVEVRANQVELNRITIIKGNATGSSTLRRNAGAAISAGGGLGLITFNSFTLKECTLKENIALDGGAGLFFAVGSSSGTNFNLTVENCDFSKNYSKYGSGIYAIISNTGAFASGNVTISNSLFSENTSADNGNNKGIAGSALWVRSLRPGTTFNTNVTNCTFVKNTDIGTDSQVNNFNRTPIAFGRISNSTHNVALNNSIFWDNETVSGVTSKSISSIFETAPSWTIKNSIAEDDFFGIGASDKTNTSSSNPLFTSVIDFTLQAGSPAIDSGDINEVIGTKDLANNLRVFTTAVDIGAYEYGSPTTRGTIFVDKDATGANNGFSWADAYTDLNNALATAGINDEIWIAEGTYTPDASDQTKSFEINNTGVKIYGGFSGTEAQLYDRVFGSNETILSGDLLGNDVNTTSKSLSTNFTNTTRRNDNSFVVVNVTSAANNTLLENLTISGAHNEASGTSSGGAITKHKSVVSLSVKKCIIKDNISRNACAGIFAEFNSPNSSCALTIENCEFTNNFSRWGTAIYSFVRTSTDANITISNSLFEGNVAEDIGNTLRGFGGSSAWIRNLGDNATLNLNFSSNTVVNNIDLGRANAALNGTTRATLGISEQTTFNGAINAEINNCIFYGNDTGQGNDTAVGRIHQDFPVAIVVKNSIDEDNFSNITATNQTNTSNSDPLFTSTTGFTLQMGSPAIDSGDNSEVIGISDLVNNNRIANTTVDMGAYEFGSTAVLSIEDLESNKPIVSIYPNPTIDYITLDLNQKIKRVTITDIYGKVLFQGDARYQLSLINYIPGIYFLNITLSNNQSLVKKIIKK